MKLEASEHQEQAAYFDWLQTVVERFYSHAKAIFAVPNGMWVAGNTKSAKFKLVQKYKREGLKKGVPDIIIPIPRLIHYEAKTVSFIPGMVLETKTGKNKCTPEQKEWLDELADLGWETKVCYGQDELKKATIDYLQLEKYGIFLSN